VPPLRDHHIAAVLSWHPGLLTLGGEEKEKAEPAKVEPLLAKVGLPPLRLAGVA
jgi:hypothetical protein